MPYRFAFFGTTEFGIPSVEALQRDSQFELVSVVTQPARPKGRKQELTPTPVAAWATEHSIPLYSWASLKENPEIEKEIASWNCDFMLVAAYGCIVPSTLLQLTKGWINLHASALPRHRGASPIAAAIAAGDAYTGVSIMQMDAGIDTGPVLEILTLPIEATMTTPQLSQALSLLPVTALGTILAAWLKGQRMATPQSAAGASYVKKLSKDSGHATWESAAALERQIRAYQPWPGVWSNWNTERLIFLRARTEPGSPTETPGTVVNRGHDWAIACTDGWLIPITVQRTGKKPVAADQAGRDWAGLIGAHLT